MATIRSKNYVKEQDLSKSELKKSCSWVASVTKRKKRIILVIWDWKSLWIIVCRKHIKTYPVSVVCPTLGCPSEGPRSDPYRGEAVPMPHLWHPLPPPADLEESSAHPHRREALHRESQTHTPPFDLLNTQNIFIISSPSCCRACLIRWPPSCFSVREVRPSLPPQESAASSPPPETRGRHQHQDPLQGPDRALPAYPAGLLKRLTNHHQHVGQNKYLNQKMWNLVNSLNFWGGNL